MIQHQLLLNPATATTGNNSYFENYNQINDKTSSTTTATTTTSREQLLITDENINSKNSPNKNLHSTSSATGIHYGGYNGEQLVDNTNSIKLEISSSSSSSSNEDTIHSNKKLKVLTTKQQQKFTGTNKCFKQNDELLLNDNLNILNGHHFPSNASSYPFPPQQQQQQQYSNSIYPSAKHNQQQQQQEIYPWMKDNRHNNTTNTNSNSINNLTTSNILKPISKQLQHHQCNSSNDLHYNAIANSSTSSTASTTSSSSSGSNYQDQSTGAGIVTTTTSGATTVTSSKNKNEDFFNLFIKTNLKVINIKILIIISFHSSNSLFSFFFL